MDETGEPVPSGQFEDYYDILQVNPNADQATVQGVYRLLAKRYHPDNPESGDARRFLRLREAYRVLSDPERRAEYDASYETARQEQWKIFSQREASSSMDDDENIRTAVLSLLYVARRRYVDDPGMGPIHLERYLGCPEEHLEFHLWYLKEKGWVMRTDSGEYAITVGGVDKVTEGVMLRADRLLEKLASDDGAQSDSVLDKLRVLKESA